MSTVRIQIRRGESTDWESIDPVLADGELGIEIDTNKIKVGNNGAVWTSLPYLNTVPSDLQNTLGDYVEIATVGNPDGPAKLDVDGNLLIPSSSIILEGSSADAYETVLTVTNPTADRTITFPNASGTVVLADGSGNVTVSGDLTVNGTTTTVNSTQVNIQNAFVFEGATANDYETTLTTVDPTADRTIQLPDASGTIALTSDIAELSQDAINAAITVANGLTINYVDPNNLLELGIDYNTIATTSLLDTSIGNVEDSIQTLQGDVNNALADKAPIVSPAFSGTVTGITAAMVGLDNVDNTADLDKPISNDTQNALDLKADLLNPTFTGNVSLPSTTTIGDVSATEIDYLNGVTSSIQAQLDDKLNSSDAASTYQTIVSGVSGIEIGYLDGVTSAIQTQLDNKQAIVSGVSDTEIGYLDGLTGAIQGQLNDKAPIANPTFTGTVSGITATMVGLGNVDNTSDVNKPVSTATQTALDLKANLAGPTFTGTVSGITKSMVGLGNVDNTSDANKPISDATQTALDAKFTIGSGELSMNSSKITDLASPFSPSDAANKDYVDTSIYNETVNRDSAITTAVDTKLSLSGGTMTGDLTLSGAPTADLHATTKAYVDNIVSKINFHQPVRVATTQNISLSGTQTIDDVSLSVGDRVLVKDQSNQKNNGIYEVKNNSWSRTADADNTPAGELAGGDFCLVLEGTVNGGYGYVCSNTSAITIGTSDITYAPFNAAKAVTAGSGLIESTPGTIDIATGGVTSAMIANGTIVDEDINASAGIAQSKISGLTTDLAAKAPLASPTFTGTVTVAANGIAFTDGTQTKQGVPSQTEIIQKTASYTLSSLGERDDLIEMGSSSPMTLTIPLNSAVAYPVGTSIDILQTSTGQVTIAGASGVTVNATPGLKLRTQWSSATLFKRAENTWVVYGDLTA